MQYSVVNKEFPMRLENIGDVDTDKNDNLYVCVRGMETPVVVFDKDRNLLRGIGRGMGIENPHCVHIDQEENIWLIDCSRHIIYKLDQDDNVIMTLGVRDQPCFESGVINGDYKTIKRPGGPFNGPTRLDTTEEGDIFIADGYNNCCVHHFSKNGKLLHSWGAPGSAPGAFNIVHSLKIDPRTGDIYIADRENRRVQIFTQDGRLKEIWDDLNRPTDVSFYGDYVFVSQLGEKLFTDYVN